MLKLISFPPSICSLGFHKLLIIEPLFVLKAQVSSLLKIISSIRVILFIFGLWLLCYLMSTEMKKSICRCILTVILYIFVFQHHARILQWGEDRRFDEMRDNLGKLAFFWMFQVYTVCLWAYILIAVTLAD